MTAVAPEAAFSLGIRAAAADRPVRVRVRHAGGAARDLDVSRYVGAVTAADRTVVDRCCGATLDVGCGPGRFTAAVAGRGVPALGADTCPEAVRQTLARGAPALLADVFAALPGEGRWRHVLLTDGNVGIGGDPSRLLRRAAELLAPGGELVCEADAPGAPLSRARVRLELGDGVVSEWFDWARVGVDALIPLAATFALGCTRTWTEDGRWFAAFTHD